MFFAFMNMVTIFSPEKSLEALSKLDFRSCWQSQYSGYISVLANFYN